MIVMQQYSRQSVVDMLNRLGYRQLAVEASRDLPDPVGLSRLEAWCEQHGLPWGGNDLISRMGGSP